MEAAPSSQELLQLILDEAIESKQREDYVYSYIQSLEHDPLLLEGLLGRLEPFFVVIPKPRVSRIIRNAAERVAEFHVDLTVRINFVRECLTWAETAQRRMLIQRVQIELAKLLLDNKDYVECLERVQSVARESRRLDDRRLLVELQLLESRVYMALGSPKARASLIAARAASSGVYISTRLGAMLDTQAGLLSLVDGDGTTAASYFQECYENLANHKAPRDVSARADAKAFLELSRIVSGQHAESGAIRSPKELDEVLRKGPLEQLRSSPVFALVLQRTRDKLVNEALAKLLQAYSVVEISHIAAVTDLEEHVVRKAITNMILDKTLDATLDVDSLHNIRGSTERPIADVAASVINAFGPPVEAVVRSFNTPLEHADS